MIAEYNSTDDPPPGNGSDPEDKAYSENRGTMILEEEGITYSAGSLEEKKLPEIILPPF